MDDTWQNHLGTLELPCLGDVVVNPRLGAYTKDALCAIKVRIEL